MEFEIPGLRPGHGPKSFRRLGNQCGQGFNILSTYFIKWKKRCIFVIR